MSLCRQNFHADAESAINKMVNNLLAASYRYLSMAYYFERDDVALTNVSKFFHELSNEQRGHAMELMEYQNMRGGKVVLEDIPKPEKDSWGNVREAVETALESEKRLNQAFIDLHDVASRNKDPQMSDYVEEEFLAEEVRFIKQLGDLLSTAQLAGPGLGEFMLEKEAFEGTVLDDPDAAAHKPPHAAKY